jgi:hypothetical protein
MYVVVDERRVISVTRIRFFSGGVGSVDWKVAVHTRFSMIVYMSCRWNVIGCSSVGLGACGGIVTQLIGVLARLPSPTLWNHGDHQVNCRLLCVYCQTLVVFFSPSVRMNRTARCWWPLKPSLSGWGTLLKPKRDRLPVYAWIGVGWDVKSLSGTWTSTSLGHCYSVAISSRWRTLICWYIRERPSLPTRKMTRWHGQQNAAIPNMRCLFQIFYDSVLSRDSSASRRKGVNRPRTRLIHSIARRCDYVLILRTVERSHPNIC